MISENLDFLSPNYTVISFLTIGNAYFLFILLFSNISHMNFVKQNR